MALLSCRWRFRETRLMLAGSSAPIPSAIRSISFMLELLEGK